MSISDEPNCYKCNDTGWIAIRSQDGSYAFPGPVPDDAQGHGISTEAARTMLAERAIAAEAENARLREALEKTTK